MITDDATVAAWHNQGLPNDRMSIENAAILTTSERWPLIIDPQQQGIKWIRNRLGPKLKVVQLGQKGWDYCLFTITESSFIMSVSTNHKHLLVFFSCWFSSYLDVIEKALACGETVLIENLQENIDPVLEPLLGRRTIKRGRLVLKLQYEHLHCFKDKKMLLA